MFFFFGLGLCGKWLRLRHGVRVLCLLCESFWCDSVFARRAATCVCAVYECVFIRPISGLSRTLSRCCSTLLGVDYVQDMNHQLFATQGGG